MKQKRVSKQFIRQNSRLPEVGEIQFHTNVEKCAVLGIICVFDFKKKNVKTMVL